jgi:hypothetical protein
MKFLVIQKIKRDLPLEKWVKLLPLQFKYFEKLEKEKTIEVEYHLIGQHNRVVITWQKIHGASISRRLSRSERNKINNREFHLLSQIFWRSIVGFDQN